MAYTRVMLLAASAVGFALYGCVEKKSAPKVPREYIEANLLPAVPKAIQNKVNADLGGKVVYLGNDVDTSNVSGGAQVRIVHYWHVTAALGSHWAVFTHVTGSKPSDWMNVDMTKMRSGYPPSKWRAGDVIRDEQVFTLNKGWNSDYAQLSLGLFRKGGKTTSDRMAIVSGPADNESRVKAFRFKVTGKANAAAGTHVVRKTPTPITIDGKADEGAWKTAGQSPQFPVAQGSPDTKGAAKARLLWDQNYLYAFVEIKDRDVFSPYTKQDDPLWKADVIELFIDADRNGFGYVELQVSPNNIHFDSWFPKTRATKSQPDWNANMKSAVIVHGTADKRDDKDVGWDVEIAIPHSAVKGGDSQMKVSIPPTPGDQWRLNVVRVEKPKSGNTAVSSWNQITYADFHALGRMLTVQFGDDTGAIPPPKKEAGANKPQAPIATETAVAPAK